MSDFTLANPADDRAMSAYQDIVSQALHFPRELSDRYVQGVGRENFRVVRDQQGRLAGGMAVLPMGHFFGGRSVACWGVAAVGIAAEHRAAGAATAMMKLALREMRERGVPLSSLYPATVPLYRRAGYELAGRREEITIPIRLLRLREPPRDESPALRLERIVEADNAQVEALYRRQAQRRAGLLDRHPILWARVRAPRGEKATGFKVVNPASGQIEGYLYALQKDVPPGTQHASYHLHITDVQFETPAAGRRLLRMLYEHHSVCDSAIMYGSADHPLIALLPERIAQMKVHFHWMARIVDVEKALTARGYSPHVKAKVSFAVRDDVLPENESAYTIEVDGGSAQVKRGGSGDMLIDIRGLAALYTGHMTADDLIVTGQLQMARDARDGGRAALDALNAIFTGPQPWLGDMF